jgi:hypothetical protein
MFYNLVATTKPAIMAWVLGALLTLDVRYMYTLTVRIADDIEDLTGVRDNTALAETILATLDGWAAAPPTVLTMTSIYQTMGGSTGKKVIALPYPIRPYSFIPGYGPGAKEALVADIQLVEVT